MQGAIENSCCPVSLVTIGKGGVHDIMFGYSVDIGSGFGPGQWRSQDSGNGDKRKLKLPRTAK